MHQSVMQWLADRLPHVHGWRGGKVLEIGSRNINGSPRPLLAEAGLYLGTDMIIGEDVDVCAIGCWQPTASGVFDLALCTEVLEHDAAFWYTIPELRRVLKPGGSLLLTARGIGFPLHGYPDDYWRFTTSGFWMLARLAQLIVIDVREDPEFPGVFGHFVRPMN